MINSNFITFFTLGCFGVFHFNKNTFFYEDFFVVEILRGLVFLFLFGVWGDRQQNRVGEKKTVLAFFGGFIFIGVGNIFWN